MTTTDNSNSMQSRMATPAMLPALVIMISLLIGNAAFGQAPPAQVTGPVPAAAHGDPGRNSQLNPNAIVVEGINYIEDHRQRPCLQNTLYCAPPGRCLSL